MQRLSRSDFMHTYLPLMNRLFHSVAIGIDSWVRIMLAGLAAYVIVEVEKSINVRKPPP